LVSPITILSFRAKSRTLFVDVVSTTRRAAIQNLKAK
jgi:hypothetical protein